MGKNAQKKTPWHFVRKRTIPTEKMHQINKKLIKLTKSRTTNMNSNINYSRVINDANTQFAQEESQLLQNLEYPVHNNQ
jgi:hypothetical protein